MGLGMPEVILILVIALIVFGPRKLPELGKSLGQAMGQFRRASDDFKRTWEQEVELERMRKSDSEITSSADGYSYGSDAYSSDSYSSASTGSPGYEPEKTESSLQNGDRPIDAGTPSAQDNRQNETTPEPAASTVAKSEQKQHWI